MNEAQDSEIQIISLRLACKVYSYVNNVTDDPYYHLEEDNIRELKKMIYEDLARSLDTISTSGSLSAQQQTTRKEIK